MGYENQKRWAEIAGCKCIDRVKYRWQNCPLHEPKNMKKKFAISIVCQNTWLSKYCNALFVAEACSKLEAKGYGYEQLEKEFPAKDGWGDYGVLVAEV